MFFCLDVGAGGVAQTMYTHVSKYKNEKIKINKNWKTYRKKSCSSRRKNIPEQSKEI
jgi:hypothetical protein